ncbi:MAG: PAS domain S-box protein, partial [Bacteroidetes bacterium]|nr:PAS domain S-box protein [Bacteroidota bacterium]
GVYFVTILITGQILFCISFKNLAEYVVMALFTMSLFVFCSFYIEKLETNPILFIVVMGMATVLSGLYNWLGRNTHLPTSTYYEPENLIYDPNSPEEVDMAFALQQSEDNYREIFNAGSDGIIIFHPEKKKPIEANQKITELLGYSPEELLNLDMDKLLLSEDITVENVINQVLNGENLEKEVKILTKNGQIVILSLAAKFILLGGHFRVIVILKNIEEKLQFIQKINQYADLFESVDVGIVILQFEDPAQDQMPRIVSANHYASHALRMRADGLAGKQIEDVFPGLKPTGGIDKILESIRSQSIIRSGNLQFHEPGSVDKFWQTKIVPLTENMVGLLFEDDTEKRQNLERLTLFRELINQSSDAIFVIDPETDGFIDYNKQFSKMLGLEDGITQKQTLGDFISGTFNAKNEKSLAEISTHGPGLYLQTFRRQDGSSIPLEVNIGFVSLNRKEYMIGVARDITERIHQEEALRESEQKYRTLVERMNEGLVLTDNDETILFVNNRLCEILQKDKGVIIGQKSYEIFAGDSSRKLIEEKFALRQKGISDQYEFQLKRENGSIIWVLIAGAPFIDGHGNMVGTIAIITDITDRKITEIKLQEKNNELDSFVYKASHDLKGPLASIIGVTNIAMEEINNPEALRYFSLISKSTERLDLILTELLDLTRINKAKINPEPILLRDLFDEIIASLQHQPLSDKVVFEKSFSFDEPYISDKKLLLSIFQNLILNSINYQNPEALQPRVEILVKKQEGRVLITIKDNGIGIPEKIKNRVFEMFYRGNSQSKGSGLGLYIVRNSVEKLSGFIDLESQPGVGTSITVSLPASPDAYL